MNFVSSKQLIDDVRAWSAELPGDLVAVAGIPRSGVLPAALLAMQRNIHLVTLAQLQRGERPWRRPLRRGVPAREAGRVLVVDDSIASGSSMRRVRAMLKTAAGMLYGAVYCKPGSAQAVDFAYREVGMPRCFEWNVFHCEQMHHACLDIDGVLCEDWTGREEDAGEGLRRYLDHLQHARPRHVPTYLVLALVTSRLKKYRSQTEDWLQRHGVRYGQLVMSPHPTAAARQAAGDHARRKAAYYTARAEARLFVESDPETARRIFRATGRPVLCATTMQLLART